MSQKLCSEMLGWVERGDNFVFDRILVFTITECIREKSLSQKRLRCWTRYRAGNVITIGIRLWVDKPFHRHAETWWWTLNQKMWNIPHHFQFGGSIGETLVCFLESMRTREISVWTYLIVWDTQGISQTRLLISWVTCGESFEFWVWLRTCAYNYQMYPIKNSITIKGLQWILKSHYHLGNCCEGPLFNMEFQMDKVWEV